MNKPEPLVSVIVGVDRDDRIRCACRQQGLVGVERQAAHGPNPLTEESVMIADPVEHWWRWWVVAFAACDGTPPSEIATPHRAANHDAHCASSSGDTRGGIRAVGTIA